MSPPERSLLGATYSTELPNVSRVSTWCCSTEPRRENRKTVIETVTPAKGTDGRWRVAGYYVRPE